MHATVFMTVETVNLEEAAEVARAVLAAAAAGRRALVHRPASGEISSISDVEARIGYVGALPDLPPAAGDVSIDEAVQRG